MAKKKRGGKRPGAGPPTKEHARNQGISVKVSVRMKAFLKDMGGTGYIETTLEKSKEFKAWLKENP